jgi:hypothetical protein
MADAKFLLDALETRHTTSDLASLNPGPQQRSHLLVDGLLSLVIDTHMITVGSPGTPRNPGTPLVSPGM